MDILTWKPVGFNLLFSKPHVAIRGSAVFVTSVLASPYQADTWSNAAVEVGSWKSGVPNWNFQLEYPSIQTSDL